MSRYWVILSVLATLVVNGLANALPINGLTTGEISDRFEVFFTPAGYVFAIWGLIYVGLIGLAIYQALPAQQDNPRLSRSRSWLAWSGVANVAWLLLWHYEVFPLTLIAMLAILGTLIMAYLRLEVGLTPVTPGERWLVRLPVGIYLGWISVATIANATVLLDYFGWSGWGINPEAWALIMIFVALILGWTLAVSRRESAYALVLVWAFAGIAVRNAAVSSVAGGAWFATALAALAALTALVSRRRAPTRAPAGSRG